MRYLMIVTLAMGALLVILVECFPAHAWGGDVPMAKAYVNDASNATFEVVDGPTNRKIRVYGYSLSVDVADEVSLKCDSTVMAAYHFDNNSGVVHNNWPGYFECAVGEDLDVTKDSATDAHVTVLYEFAR